MVIREKRFTVEAFREYTQLPENEGRKLELEDGLVIEMASSSPINTIVAGRIIHYLNAFVIPNDLGHVTSPDGGFKLKAGTSRQPDAAFISKARLPQIPDAFDIAPDLAVEVVSPQEDVLRKVDEYLAASTQIVWTVYCDEQRVFVFSQADYPVLRGVPHNIGDVLDGGNVLVGFSLSVSDIFP